MTLLAIAALLLAAGMLTARWLLRAAADIVRAAVEPIVPSPAAVVVTGVLFVGLLVGIALHVRSHRRRWRCARVGCRNRRLPGSHWCQTCAALQRWRP